MRPLSDGAYFVRPLHAPGRLGDETKWGWTHWTGKRGILAGNWKSLIGRQVCSEARLGSARLGSAWLIIGPSCGQALGAIYLCPLSEMTAGQLWPEQGTQQATQKQQKFLPKISREAKPNWKWPELEAKGGLRGERVSSPSVSQDVYEKYVWTENVVGQRQKDASSSRRGGGRRKEVTRISCEASLALSGCRLPVPSMSIWIKARLRGI